MSLSKAEIEQRIQVFSDCIRTQSQHFRSGSSWWLVKHTNYSREHYESAVTLLDLLSIPETDMDYVFNNKWVSKIGRDLFGSHFRQGRLGKSYFITILSPDNMNEQPTRENIVLEDHGVGTRSASGPVDYLRRRILQHHNFKIMHDDDQHVYTTPSSPSNKRSLENNEQDAPIKKRRKGRTIPIPVKEFPQLNLESKYSPEVHKKRQTMIDGGMKSLITIISKVQAMKLNKLKLHINELNKDMRKIKRDYKRISVRETKDDRKFMSMNVIRLILFIVEPNAIPIEGAPTRGNLSLDPTREYFPNVFLNNLN